MSLSCTSIMSLKYDSNIAQSTNIIIKKKKKYMDKMSILPSSIT